MKYRNHKNAEAVSRFWNKPLDRPDWYRVQAQSDDETEILIYDVIGWPYNDASELIRSLKDIKSKSILVRINSPGGDVFDGTAIFNALQSHESKVVTRIEGLAASMASVIAMAGKEVQAYKNTMLMIHNAWTFAAGDHAELREVADLLEKIDGNLLDIYHGKTKAKAGKREIKQMMDDETWMTAEEAKEKGFVNTIIESGAAAKAEFDLSIFGNVPDDLIRAQKPPTERQLERALRDAGLSRADAKALLAGRREHDARAMDEVKAALNKTLKIIGG
ncbi:MAG: Clp protease ClpP [Sphaerochaeta sp.]|jgi:ATP-dependent Clp endopeptidase proteolytic subunit ClpP|nr:Clp protease ClpP [Sphaerochaeta sp.]MDD5533781.1 Clp protease ClpP [Syntrophales bacterium]